MKKYDCNKTLDFSHERRRMCNSVRGCGGCPLLHKRCPDMNNITEEHIAIVQKWSDENPEQPKLTRKEHDFLEMLVDDGLTIKRTARGLCICSKTGETLVHLYWRNFKDIDFVAWTVEELLKLEVEE